jgi:hypothetical protein
MGPGTPRPAVHSGLAFSKVHIVNARESLPVTSPKAGLISWIGLLLLDAGTVMR